MALPHVVLVLGLIFQGFASPLNDGRIVGGEEVNVEDYPHQVALEYIDNHLCGGSIIGKRHILTASHCTNGLTYKFLKVRAGSSIIEEGGQLIEIATVFMHPQFDELTYDYDVAVLELKEDIILGDTARIIKMIDHNAPVDEGNQVTVSGWGYTTEGGSKPDHLRAVDLQTIDSNLCGTYYGDGQITDRMLCTHHEGGGKDACQGDSGGPLIMGQTLVGVVSWGTGCARPDYPGVFASVSYLRKFVTEVSGI